MSTYDKYRNKGNKTQKAKKASVPQDVNHWAADAYKALEKAVIAFEEDYPNRIDEADEYAVDNVLADLDAEGGSEDQANEDEQGENDWEDQDHEELHYPVLFLLCYLDAHVSIVLLIESILESIMNNLTENYELIIS